MEIFYGKRSNQPNTAQILQVPCKAGFSLMEVTISLAIVAVVAIPLMGMLSVGMNSNRNSADRAIISQIVDQIGREIEQANYDDLPSELPIAFFDANGVKVDSTNTERIFTARATVIKDVEIPASGGGMTSSNLARVLVDVAANPANQSATTLFEEDSSGGLINRNAKRFTLLISQND